MNPRPASTSNLWIGELDNGMDETFIRNAIYSYSKI